jgi:hypothetical protein
VKGGTNNMKLMSAMVIGGLVILMEFLTPTVILATPMADIRYVETGLGGGIWQYEYTVFNKSDPMNDPGVNLYDIAFPSRVGNNLNFSILSVIVPTGWEFIGDINFVDMWSLTPGSPPDGTDVAPGGSLEGFVLKFDEQVGDLLFDVTFANPEDSGNPFVESVTAAPAPVPEPATILLMMSGLAGIGAIRRRRVRTPLGRGMVP